MFSKVEWPKRNSVDTYTSLSKVWGCKQMGVRKKKFLIRKKKF